MRHTAEAARLRSTHSNEKHSAREAGEGNREQRTRAGEAKERTLLSFYRLVFVRCSTENADGGCVVSARE